MGAATHLMRMFPVQKMRRMFYTGEPITAAEAYRLGAVESVVKRDELLPAARALAENIAAKSPRAIRLAKWALNGIELIDIKKSYRFEQGFTFELYTSPDSQEARSRLRREARREPSRTSEGLDQHGPDIHPEKKAFRARSARVAGSPRAEARRSSPSIRRRAFEQHREWERTLNEGRLVGGQLAGRVRRPRRQPDRSG